MKIKINFNYREIIKGLIISLFTLISIVSIGYGLDSNPKDIWAAVIISQIGFSLIWLAIRLGAFSTSSRGSRRLGIAFRDRSHSKLGIYSDKKNQKNKAKEIWEIQKNNKKKSKQGIYVMIIFCLIEIFSTLWLFI